VATGDAKAALAQIQAALASLMPTPAAPAAAVVDVETVRRLIQDELKNWTIQIEGAPAVQLSGKPHAKLGQLVQLMALREPVYMKGPAGSGKSTAAEMAAESFGLPFYHVGKVDSKYDLIGFVDANGTYQSSSLYSAYKDGGVFLWDEVDASAPDALTAFLNLIEGRSFEFPCGKVEKHVDFRPIAAGNTSMLGGTAEYSGRTRQDGAFKDRFCEIEWGYDEDLEKALYGSAAVTVQELRAKAEKLGIRHIISPRASRRLQKLLEIYPRDTAIELAVRNGLDSETWGRLCK
jgi:MoxR-like ATPase